MEQYTEMRNSFRLVGLTAVKQLYIPDMKQIKKGVVLFGRK